ncbi:MAG TPA: maleylpyruvate isomerase family mycothiol-dependent enzyme [Pseudonocardiaceae bacterium]|nr:maleylpyruvate isomerase family mycothiol-dependent enzyme [Pseudonocardiaceae bacterium]
MSERALIDYDRLLHVIGEESQALADSIQGARRDAGIPGCPGLTLGETARHVGSLYRMVWRWLRDGQRPGEWQRDPIEGQELSDYVRTGVAPLLVELHEHAPSAPAPTWWPADQTYGFWRRRMAHESTVHRYDVQGAAGLPLSEVPEDVALDGIDEVLTLWFEHRLSVLGVSGTRDQIVSVRAGGLEWLARAGSGHTSTRRPGEGPVDADAGNGEDAAHAVVSGPAMQVYLWLWGRRPDRAVQLDGNRDAIAQLWALLRLATR